jgi:HEPN domain-containing protein
MTMQPERIHLARQWVARAEEDLLNAEHTLGLREKCPVGTVCFHAQQCAEKYLKALLTCRGIAFPKTHDLVVLLNRIGSESGLDLRTADVQPLNRYSIGARYPGDWEPISLQRHQKQWGRHEASETL